MATLSENITRLNNAIESLKTKLENSGVDTTNMNIENLINSIDGIGGDTYQAELDAIYTILVNNGSDIDTDTPYTDYPTKLSEWIVDLKAKYDNVNATKWYEAIPFIVDEDYSNSRWEIIDNVAYINENTYLCVGNTDTNGLYYMNQTGFQTDIATQNDGKWTKSYFYPYLDTSDKVGIVCPIPQGWVWQNTDLLEIKFYITLIDGIKIKLNVFYRYSTDTE